MTTTQKGMPSLLRLRAYRSDPDGGLLGPLKATHFGFGDVEGLRQPPDRFGRERPRRRRHQPAAVDPGGVRPHPVRRRSADRLGSGNLPQRRTAGFAKADGSQRYVFEDVQLLYGENRIRSSSTARRARSATRDELINVGQDNVPAGKTWYWAGFNQPGRDLVHARISRRT